MTHNSSVNFKLIHFLLWTKESHQSPNFDTFKCSGENSPNSSCHFSNHKSVFFFKFCITLQCHERLLLCTFLALALYNLVARSPLKRKSFRILSAQVKIRQIPHVNLKMESQFLFNFCIILHCHGT